MRAHARSGVTLTLLVLVVLAIPWSSATAQTPLTPQAQTIIAKVLFPWGGGNGLGVIRDGDHPSVGNLDLRRQYDSYLGDASATEDWVGYTFASPQTFSRVVFQEGINFHDGGHFTSLTVQVRQGGAWVPVQSLSTTPAYPGGNGVSYETFTLNFDAIQGDGIRIYGAPGGSARFISVGELEVFGPSAGGTTPPPTSPPTTPPADASVTAQAQTIIAKVLFPWGGGNGLAVIRDGDRPSVGNLDLRRQYDSYLGDGSATEDWVGYTFASPQTFSRVVFQEGINFQDGGHFTSLTVQVRQGGAWVPVQSLSTTPAYPGGNGVSYETFTLRFNPIQGDGVRIYGAPGGSARFVSVGELEVFGTTGTGGGGTTSSTTPPTSSPTSPPTSPAADASVTALAQSVIAKVLAPWGSGGGLNIIHDGDRPPVGSGDTRRQYDSYSGGGAATEDWVGYTFGINQTFTRVVFQEGMNFQDGGHFANLTVQVRQNGAWVPVQGLSTTPAYPGGNGVSYETFTLRFNPIQGNAIRIYGAPGGSARFISVGELDVFASGTTGGGGSGPGPDLTVGALTVSPLTVPSAGTVNVTFTVRNAGTSAVGQSSAGLYLATTPDAALPGVATLKTVTVPALSAGASTVVATSASLPSRSPGAHFIIVAADPGSAIAESSETNNRASASFTIGGAAGGITAWVVDPLTRVQPTDSPGPIQSAWIKAARNEYEAFQLVIRAPSGQALSNVNVVASALIGPGGASAGTVRLYREHYIQVTTRSPYSPYPAGWYPDALIPFVNPDTGQPLGGGRFPAAPFPVSAGRNQPIWVEVQVAPNAPPGTYQGQLTVTAQGMAPTVVPVTLTVWNFTMPTRPTLQSWFGSVDTITLADKYQDELLRHKVAALPPDRTVPRVLSDGSIDTSASTGPLTEYLEKAAAWAIPWSPATPFRDPLGADRGRTQRYFQQIQEYLRSHGWLSRAAIYVYDEPDTAAKLPTAIAYARLVKEAAPDLRVLITTHIRSELYGLVDVWVVGFRDNDPELTRDRQARGDEVWSYTAIAPDPNVPIWLLDHPLVDYRLPGWLNWTAGPTGLLYWGTNYWVESADPWTDPTTYGPHNLEGALVYPGSAVGYNGPIVSMRLKAIRDAIEDYESLRILASMGDQAYAYTLAAGVGVSFRNFSRDPGDILEARERVGDRIHELAR